MKHSRESNDRHRQSQARGPKAKRHHSTSAFLTPSTSKHLSGADSNRPNQPPTQSPPVSLRPRRQNLTTSFHFRPIIYRSQATLRLPVQSTHQAALASLDAS